MKFKLHRENGALNSSPIFDAFEHGLKKLGHEIVHSSEDVTVIWSVLWYGRMRPNKDIYERAIASGRPVIIIEVGNLIRGVTWRIGINHVHRQGIFANTDNLDPNRPKKIGVFLKEPTMVRANEILITGQHQHSLQWQGQPPITEWVKNVVLNLRKLTDKPIVVRPHPRSPFSLNFQGIKILSPRRLPNSYDDFDINYNFHCVINHNSGPTVQAAINGTPIICHSSGLAYPVSDLLENVEKISLPDRNQWFLELCHTEWTVEEIASGFPIERLLPDLKKIIDKK